MTPTELIINALEAGGFKPRQRGDQWYARCPVHGGRDNDSLSIAEGADGRALLTCHSKACGYHDIMHAIGLDPADGFPRVVDFNGRKLGLRSPTNDRTELGDPEATYDYIDEDGALLYQVLRYRTATGKTFRQRQPDGDGWLWTLRDARRVLYRLPAVLGAIERQERVYLVEGEKDVHALESLGVVATTALGGACEKASSWLPEWSESLTGADVVILPDNDEPGRKHAATVTAALEGYARSVRTVNLPDLPPKGDAADWVAAGGTVEDLERLCASTRLRVVTLDYLITEAEFPPKEPLLAPWLCTQDLTMIHAVRGVGKTHFLLGITLALATGTEMLGWAPAAPHTVMYVDGEMPGDSLRNRFLSAVHGLGGKPILAMPKIITPDLQPNNIRRLSTPEGRADLLEVLTGDVSLVILDNLACLYGGDENDAAAWDDMQTFILQLRTRGISAILVHHSGKSGEQRGTSHREDVLDTVINLRRPGDYRADQGARFEVIFEKARNLHGEQIPEIEASLIAAANGGTVWAWQRIEDSRLRQIIDLYTNAGMKQNQIAAELGMSQSNVSRRLRWAKENGLV